MCAVAMSDISDHAQAVDTSNLGVCIQVNGLATPSPDQTLGEQPHCTNASASSDLSSGDCCKQTIDCPTTHLPFEEQATRMADTLIVIQKMHRCSLQEATIEKHSVISL